MSLKSCHYQTLVVASSNPGKVEEFVDFLAPLQFQVLAQPEGMQIEEHGITFAENARLKALEVATRTGYMALADDSGLCVDALGGEPGVYSSRYASNDQQRIEKLLTALEGIRERSAHFSSALCLATPQNEVLLEVEGVCRGVITNAPRGDQGFGYDPIFEVLDKGLTFSEMSLEQKRAWGHRGKAFSLLEPKLKQLVMAK